MSRLGFEIPESFECKHCGKRVFNYGLRKTENRKYCSQRCNAKNYYHNTVKKKK